MRGLNRGERRREERSRHGEDAVGREAEARACAEENGGRAIQVDGSWAVMGGCFEDVDIAGMTEAALRDLVRMLRAQEALAAGGVP